ncbi:MFS transporter [Saccharothrix sp. AJ9571]|nr:MFS transporter [Saccharothrix sp. AJ9571]
MTGTALSEKDERAGVKQWAGLALLLLPVTLMTADLGVLWLATPHLTADLRPSSGQLLWITDIYGFMTAGFLVVMGTLGDRLGRRRLLLAGSAGFIAASLLAAYANSPELLIAARAVLGVAGAAVLPSTLALISHLFTDPRQRATAIAMWVTALSAGVALGPVAGGVLLEHFWWGSVFLMGVPIMVLALVAAPVLLPEYRDPGAGRLDPLSVVLFLAAVLPVVYGVKRLAEHGPQWIVLGALVTGVAFGWWFARRQRSSAAPLLDLRLFADRTFATALVVLLLGLMALNGVEYLVPQYLQFVTGLSPMETALWLLPGAAGLIVGSQLTPVLAARLRPAYVIAAGLAVALLGLAAMAVASGVAVAAFGLTVVMFGVAPITVLGTSLAVSAAPPEKAGAAAATGQTAYDLGLALGIAVTGSVAVAVYRGEVVTPGAEDTIGGALTTAAELPPGQAAALLDEAETAFTTGFQAAAMVSGALALVLIALVLTALRHLRPASS